jgi:transcriptional regulator with GAF, ATPase, and Fis domain
MACATIAFTNPGDLEGTSFSNASALDADQFYLESEVNSEPCFGDIVGKSQALRRVLEQVAIVAPTDSTVLLHGKRGQAKNWSHAPFTTLAPAASAHLSD